MPDLLFAHDFPPMGGGIARWMEALAMGYPPGTLTVSTGICPGYQALDAALPNPVNRVGVPADRLKTLPGQIRWSRRAVALARQPGVRFAWCDSVRPAGYAAHRAFKATGLPYGIIVHGGDLFTLRQRLGHGWFKRRVIRALMRDAAVYVANSQWTAAHCRELLVELGLPEHASRVRTVLLGTDPARWCPGLELAGAFRARRGLPEGRWLVTVARLVRYKGIDTAIRVTAALAQEFPDLHYAVIGQGEQKAELQSLAAALGVTDRVHLLTDVGDNELPAAYAVGDIYLGLTRETATDIEGFGISFLEAAATGLPVVATASGGIPDAVADGTTGVLVDPGSTDEAIEAVRQLLNNHALARQLGSAGRERVLQDFTWPRAVNEMRAIAAEFGRAS